MMSATLQTSDALTDKGDAVVITGAIPIRCGATQAYTFDGNSSVLELA